MEGTEVRINRTMLFRSLRHWALYSAAALWPVMAGAAEVASVRLADGRLVRGIVDARSDGDFLWLNVREPDLFLASRFAWSQVSEIDQGNSHYGRDEFRAKLMAIPRHEENPLPPPKENRAETVAAPLWPRPRSVTFVDPRAVQSLQITVRLANWDNDPEPDGLRVFIAPLDWNGHVVPVNGTIDFRLRALRQRSTGGQLVRRRDPVARLEDWSQRVWVHDFGPDGVVRELPFRSFQPWRDVDFAPEALLTARLGISGVGVFEASNEFVILRPPSRFRDNLQLQTGRRFP